ncbi:MAG TPA: hypothetical protein VLK37_11485 [Solirubrobacterales bacterium]|nr:hypothetical protein [Solirubrobacterales bacterium]
MAVMMNPRETWTDERLDDLSKKVDRGFSESKAEMKSGFERMDARLDRMQNTLVGAAAVIIAALLGIIATQL